MTQPFKEKVFRFQIGDKVNIDYMNFIIKEMSISKGENGIFSIVLWGRKPNATTIGFSRVVRLEELQWKPRNIKLITEKGKVLSLKYDIEEAKKLSIVIQKQKDKIISVLAEMDTKLNDFVMYDFN